MYAAGRRPDPLVPRTNPLELRSQSDLGADQEIWALLCLYQVLHQVLISR
jgi:hypothetical protein